MVNIREYILYYSFTTAMGNPYNHEALKQQLANEKKHQKLLELMQKPPC